MKTANHLRRLTALTLTCLTTLGLTIIASPSASAQTNRRICTYSGVHTVSSIADGSVRYWEQWVMNYKKQGGCPVNRNAVSLRNAATGTSWEKITCEEYGARVKISFDPCPGMTMDSLYLVKWYVDNKPTTFADHGHY